MTLGREIPPRPTVRRLPYGRWQGVYGRGGPGKTACFSTRAAAEVWSIEKKLMLREEQRERNVGVVYDSHGKCWRVSSPVWWEPRVVTKRKKKAAALAFARERWLKKEN